jgi:hypothetical protein
VRRLGVASPDSAAESPVYGGEPADWAGRRDWPSGTSGGGHSATRPRPWRPFPISTGSAAPGLGAPPLAAASRIVGSAESAWLPAPSSAAAPSVHQPGSDLAAKTELASQLPSFLHVSGDQASQLALLMYSIAIPDNSRHVGCRPAKRKMVCKGRPCVHASDEDPMTWFASSMTVRPGRRLPRKRTDVHGREG